MSRELTQDQIAAGMTFAKQVLNDSDVYDCDFWGIQQKYKSNCLGYGCFSIVMLHPDLEDVAIKLSIAPQDGGVLYAYWARDNQDLRGVPEIYHIEQLRSNFTVILMKRYHSTVAQHPNFEIAPDITAERIRYHLSRQFEGKAFKYAHEFTQPISSENLGKLEAYFSTIKKIAKFFRGRVDFDLHDENVMIDEISNELIIIDPLSFVGGQKI